MMIAHGWGVVVDGAIKIRTVSDTRRAAIINWLLTDGGLLVVHGARDDAIEAVWDAHRGNATVVEVEVKERANENS